MYLPDFSRELSESKPSLSPACCHASRVSLLKQTLSRFASQLIETNAVTLRESAYCKKAGAFPQGDTGFLTQFKLAFLYNFIN